MGADGAAPVRTALFAPPACLQHLTAPEPRTRSDPEPPPENVARLHALTHPGARDSTLMSDSLLGSNTDPGDERPLTRRSLRCPITPSIPRPSHAITPHAHCTRITGLQ